MPARGFDVSQPQPLQERVLSVLVERGAVKAKELHHWLAGVDHIALDCALNALLRANKVSLALGSYEVVRLGEKDVVRRKGEPAPPSAQDEAAASLTPASPKTAHCIDCGPKPAEAFQHSRRGKPHKLCIECARKRQIRGLQIAASRQPITGAAPDSRSIMAGDQAIVTAEDSLREYGESSGPDRLPPPDNPERALTALPSSPQGSAAGSNAAEPPNTSTEATAQPDPMLSALAQKRALLTQRRERLRREFEASEPMSTLEHQIGQIDSVTEQVRTLLEGA
jgi:hypothetical protein